MSGMFWFSRPRPVKIPADLADELLDVLFEAKNVLQLHDQGNKASTAGQVRVRIESLLRRL